MTEVNLTNCESEPIHTPGAIQPHGALVVFSATSRAISHVSSNAPEILGLECRQLLGNTVGTLFLESERAAREAILLREAVDARPLYLFSIRLVQSQKLFDAIAHRMGDSIFLELEVSAENRELSLPELYRMVQRSVIRLQQAQSLEALCQECVGQVRRLTGFDRVMAYRFDRRHERFTPRTGSASFPIATTYRLR
jgi:light-regulated signal transduction histidine kinase (bacteriophytochrome)